MACKTCRSRKVKCTRERPRCKNCASRSLDCVYAGERVKRRKLNEGKSLMNRNVPSQPTSCDSLSQQNDRLDSRETDPREAGSGTFVLNSGVRNYGYGPENSTVAYLSPVGANDSVLSENCQMEKASQRKLKERNLLDQLLDPNNQPARPNCTPSVWIRTEIGDEYTGPSSGISAISDQGLKYIRRKVQGCGCLCNTFKQLRSTLLNHLRQAKCMGPDIWSNFKVTASQKALPSWATIEKYVDVYFLDIQVHFPILDRKWFQSQLMAFKAGPSDDNPSWKALLFAVLASGCRATLSDENPTAFQLSANEAWSYFVAALSYEPMLVHVTTDLTAVQALAVMTVFAQGLSSPQRLEYTLCSTASRMAFSQALHLPAPAHWNLTDAEKDERNRTFWVIYCLDKTLALRCGRPSAIDDSEVGCEFPKGPGVSQSRTMLDSDNGPPPFGFLLCVAKYARICSRISRELYSAFALSRPCTDLKDIGCELLNDLQDWHTQLPAMKRLKHLDVDKGEFSEAQLVFLQISYFYAICAVHRRFTAIFCHDDREEAAAHEILGQTLPSQIEAARSIILMTKHLDIESFSPGWLVFYQPMTALITIFLHVLFNSSHESAAHDIALMEVAVGFLGRLEYITSGEAGFTQVTEFVRQARIVIDKTAVDSCQCANGNIRAIQCLSSPGEVHQVSSRAISNDKLHSSEDPSSIRKENSALDLNPTLGLLTSNDASLVANVGSNSRPAEDSAERHTTQITIGETPSLSLAQYDPWLELWLSPSGLDPTAVEWQS